MDPVSQQIDSINWIYADKDPTARTELMRRIAEAGKKLGLITYSDLVRGVLFHFPNIRDGAPYEIQTYDWSGLDRKIVGEFLGHISGESWKNHGFMASALVVSGSQLTPSDIFFDWMKQLKILPNLRENTVLAFWADQVNKAHHFYRSQR